jgi:HD-GYP domain-containing protein (c-di-GMP phosphodiesterase class II)
VRPYKEAWPEERVLGHIRGLSGTHFDALAIALFERALASNVMAA